jgi:hypothetical protein
MAVKEVPMKRLLIPLIALVFLVTPAIIPTIQINQQNDTAVMSSNVTTTTAPTTNTATFDVPFTAYAVSVSPGGEAHAWNLIYCLCQAGVPGMCELFEEGWGILW